MRYLRFVFLLVISLGANSAHAAVNWQGSGVANLGNFSSWPDAIAAGQNSSGYGSGYTHQCQSTVATTDGYRSNCQVYNSSGQSLGSAGSYVAQAILVCSSPNTKVNGTPPSCTCPAPTVWDASLGQCLTPCTSPQVRKPNGSCGDPCVTGDSKQITGFSTLAAGGQPTANICSNYCNYVLQAQASVDPNAPTKRVLGVVVGGSTSGYRWTAVYKGNGAACSMDSNPDAPHLDSAPDLLTDSSTGNTAQWHAGDQCGYVNGKYFCQAPTPTGTCGKTTDGWGVCTTTPLTTMASPPAPNTGTAGQPANPIAAISQGGTVTNIYNTSTVSSSTSALPTVSGTGSGNSGSGTSSTPTPTSTCGGNGQPACNSLAGGFDCSSPPSTGGDPILGYSALQEWKTACALTTPDKSVTDAAIDAGLGTTTEGGLLHNKGTVDVSGWFDSAAASGGGSLSDIPVSLPQMGITFTIPLSQVNKYVGLLRALLLIGAAVASLKIVQGAF